MNTAPIDYAEITKRVNQRLAEQAKPGVMPEVVGARYVEHSLRGGANYLGKQNANLVMKIAAEVAGEKAK